MPRPPWAAPAPAPCARPPSAAAEAMSPRPRIPSSDGTGSEALPGGGGVAEHRAVQPSDVPLQVGRAHSGEGRGGSSRRSDSSGSSGGGGRSGGSRGEAGGGGPSSRPYTALTASTQSLPSVPAGVWQHQQQQQQHFQQQAQQQHIQQPSKSEIFDHRGTTQLLTATSLLLSQGSSPLSRATRQSVSGSGAHSEQGCQQNPGDVPGAREEPPLEGARRQYLRWTLQLQSRFLEAVKKIGGLKMATPLRIAQLMQVTVRSLWRHERELSK